MENNVFITDTEATSEERIYRDVNGFYEGQIRFLPLTPWDKVANDGWRSFCCSSSLDWVRGRMNPKYRDSEVVTHPDYFRYHK